MWLLGHYAQVVRDEDGIVHMLRGAQITIKIEPTSLVNFRKSSCRKRCFL